MQRINKLSEQLNQASLSSPCAASFPKSDDDVVIVSACRTPIGRGKRGGFRDSAGTQLLTPVFKAAIERAGIKPSMIDDVVIGAVNQNGSRRQFECRMASQLAGCPSKTACMIVNRQCSSGLQAIANVAASIKDNQYDIGLAGGCEVMSEKPQGAFYPYDVVGMLRKKIDAAPGGIASASKNLFTMGQTSENVASKFGITREEQDRLAVMSHERAIAAWEEGRFQEEVVPVTTFVKDPKTGKETKVTVSRDEGMRPGTTMEKLAKLRAVFKKGGSTTAGNSSQVSDGASACVLMKRKRARELGCPVLGVFRGFVSVGCDPDIMGIGPAVAIPELLRRQNISISDIDLFEINEAFASQATYCVKELGLSWDKVNVNGGAIAIGHPLGMTGARMTATLLYEMRRRKAKLGIVSMCIGSGQGAAGLFEVE